MLIIFFQRQYSEQRGGSLSASLKWRICALCSKCGCTEDPAAGGNWTHRRPRWTEHRQNFPLPLWHDKVGVPWLLVHSWTVFLVLYSDQSEIRLCAFVTPACWCGVTPTSPALWRTQGRRRSAPACPTCVLKACSGSSQPASSAIQTGWPSSSPPWVRYTHSFQTVKGFTPARLRIHHILFLADISEDNDEPDDGTEMNFFYIRQFQVHLKRMYLVILYLF